MHHAYVCQGSWTITSQVLDPYQVSGWYRLPALNITFNTVVRTHRASTINLHICGQLSTYTEILSISQKFN